MGRQKRGLTFDGDRVCHPSEPLAAFPLELELISLRSSGGWGGGDGGGGGGGGGGGSGGGGGCSTTPSHR